MILACGCGRWSGMSVRVCKDYCKHKVFSGQVPAFTSYTQCGMDA